MVMMKLVNTPHFDQIPFCPYAVFCSYIKIMYLLLRSKVLLFQILIYQNVWKFFKKSKKKIIMENKNFQISANFLSKEKEPKKNVEAKINKNY